MSSAHIPPSTGRAKLTKALCRNHQLPSGVHDHTLYDSEVIGFGHRIREGGSRKFVFNYNIGKLKRRMSLGDDTQRTVEDARKAAEKLKARVQLGEDPYMDKHAARIDAAASFGVHHEEYLAGKKEDLRSSSYADVERHLKKHAKRLHSMPLTKIKTVNVASLLAAIKAQSSGVTADRVHTSLGGFFGWAKGRGLVESNPVDGIPYYGTESRGRVLLPSELRAIWNALDDGQYADIVRLLALTAQRLNEIAGLHWSEIHDGAIVLPPERAKKEREHVAPLSPTALEIITRQPRRGARDLIFGRNHGGGPFSGWSKAKNELDAKIEAMTGAPLKDWRLHDLRRTFATYAGGGLSEGDTKRLPPEDRSFAAGLDRPPHVIEAVLGHIAGHGKGGGVAATYNRSTYAKEKREALDLWADRLMAIVECHASNITPMRWGLR